MCTIVSSLNTIQISEIKCLVLSEISIICTNQNQEVLFVSRRVQPHNRLSEIKWVVIFEEGKNLKFINKTRFMVRNKMLRDKLFKEAKIQILKPNKHLPEKELPIASTIPKRRQQPVQLQTRYRPIITRNTKWSEEDFTDFMKKRFPE